MKRSDLVQYAAIALLLAVVVVQVAHGWRPRDARGHTSSVARDFADFYCAGSASNAGADPYLTRQYDVCGRGPEAYRPIAATLHRNPAPIPGYDVAVFRLIALLPYTVAAQLWLAFLAIAFAVTIVVMAQISTLPPLLVFATLFLPFRTAADWGQFAPLLLCLLALAAMAVARGRFLAASLAALGCLIEPHVALPVCGALLVWCPRTRIPIVAGGVVLAVLSVATLGVAENVEYVRHILPLQLIAEVSSDSQLSLTWLLNWFGLDEGRAVAFGSVSYLAIAGTGVILAGTLSRRLKLPELIPLVPAAFAVIGGPFIHAVQVFVALLAALVFAGRVPRAAGLAWTSIVLLAVLWSTEGWVAHPWSFSRLESIFVVAAIVAFAARAASPVPRSAAVAAAVAAYVVVSSAILHVSRAAVREPETPARYLQRIGGDIAYTSGQWGLDIRTADAASGYSYQIFATKVPQWLALVVLVCCVLRLTLVRSSDVPQRLPGGHLPN